MYQLRSKFMAYKQFQIYFLNVLGEVKLSPHFLQTETEYIQHGPQN